MTQASRYYSVTMSDRNSKSHKNLLLALKTQDADVVFSGHANFGLGPAFNTNYDHVNDFTNFSGRGEAAVSVAMLNYSDSWLFIKNKLNAIPAYYDPLTWVGNYEDFTY